VVRWVGDEGFQRATLLGDVGSFGFPVGTTAAIDRAACFGGMRLLLSPWHCCSRETRTHCEMLNWSVSRSGIVNLDAFCGTV
jgi:hypothetical protein